LIFIWPRISIYGNISINLSNKLSKQEYPENLSLFSYREYLFFYLSISNSGRVEARRTYVRMYKTRIYRPMRRVPRVILPSVTKSQKNDGVYRYVETAAFVHPEITAAYPESEQEPPEPHVRGHDSRVARNRLPWSYENIKNKKKIIIYIVVSRRVRGSSRYYGFDPSIDIRL